ncbi:MAG: OadG family protein [Clostridia bacterium]
MLGSVVTMLIGMGLTFCILLLIWVIVSFISRRMNIKKKNNNTTDDDFDSIPYLPFDGQAPAEQTAGRTGAGSGAAVNTGEAGCGADTCTAAAAPGNDDGGPGGISPEIIAVITAAIEAFREEEGSGRLVVRKIRRLPADTQPWSIAARADCIESRKF